MVVGMRCSYSPFPRPMSSSPRLAMTSLAFMLVEVPAPPWIMSTTNWSWSLPAMISSQASAMASRWVFESTPSS